VVPGPARPVIRLLVGFGLLVGLRLGVCVIADARTAVKGVRP